MREEGGVATQRRDADAARRLPARAQTSARLSDGEQFPSSIAQPLSHRGTERAPLMETSQAACRRPSHKPSQAFCRFFRVVRYAWPRVSAAMSLAGTTWRSQKGSTVIKDRAPANRPRSAGPQPQPDVFAPADVFARAGQASPSRRPTCSRRARRSPACSRSRRGAAARRRRARSGGDPRLGRRGALRLVDRRRHAGLGRQRRRRAQARATAPRSRPGAATPGARRRRPRRPATTR